jgi:hypothetical protein
MSQPEAQIATRGMSTETRALTRTTRERPVAASARLRGQPPSSPLEEFKQLYLQNVDVLVKRPVAAKTHDRVPGARRLLTVAGEHMACDAEQPCPV